MSKNKIDRTGEININNFGSKMIIIEYRKYSDIDVYFPEYDWTFKHTSYKEFKNGEILCPYERRYYGIGYLGEGKYKVKENDKTTKCYDAWRSMLQRCYDEKFHKKRHTYKGCKMRDNWHNFQNFGKWYYDNYYEIEGQKMCLDKDILLKGNKIYSPETCIFVPNNINTLFIKRDKSRGNFPIGVSYHKANKKFVAKCNVYDFENKKKKTKHLGYYDAPEEAFNKYKEFKESYIKEVADYYRDQIPKKLYDAMYQYEVEITD
ncbi:AP2 domain-containing protein [uncultured Clostridium sp.]|uniref:AP2 domain-containing protein n=1 Tax=uncultured Clostridium sp. TaxID=59620 RepID=UPI00206E2748|nr:AP2 domain-containing protein [uncultured Clostridium sp.]DAZ34358.1 MAG TPA: hypothetical protein [Caudoviricetes sp.]